MLELLEALTFLPAAAALLLFQSAQDRDSEVDNGLDAVVPEDRATFFSKVFFAWFGPVVALGHRRPLTREDVPPVPECVHPESNDAAFRAAWEKEKAHGYTSRWVGAAATAACTNERANRTGRKKDR